MEKKQILIVDDDPSFTKLLKFNLEKEGDYEVREENESPRVLSVLKNFHPDIIILDVMMPHPSGADIAAEIKADETLRKIPIIFLTAALSEQEAHHRDGLIGGYPFLAKPVQIDDLMMTIQKNILKAQGLSFSSKKKILIIDDEDSFTKLFKLNLEKTGGYEVQEENKASQAIETAKKFKPDLIILDIIMADADGSEVASLLKMEKNLKDIPIIFLTAVVSREEIDSNSGGRIGGHPFIAKPADVEEIVVCIEKTLRERHKPKI